MVKKSRERESEGYLREATNVRFVLIESELLFSYVNI
jgi:hypothetical protein